MDAAHIERWADSQNDDLSNGLALSKSAHWMFDQGLWSVEDRLRSLVAGGGKFTEHGPDFMMLRSLAGRHLLFDPAAALRPRKELLRVHRAAYGFKPQPHGPGSFPRPARARSCPWIQNLIAPHAERMILCKLTPPLEPRCLIQL